MAALQHDIIVAYSHAQGKLAAGQHGSFAVLPLGLLEVNELCGFTVFFHFAAWQFGMWFLYLSVRQHGISGVLAIWHFGIMAMWDVCCVYAA